ncbi:MAG: asparagine synthetase B, partial [Candidatus Nealsonbacteria bacterium CG08_land_8_20_14_0_20_36_22]
MCGIAGIIKEDSQKYKPQLKKMTDSLSHRGPDAEGFYFFKDCGLGHRRLSIIDLKTGDQPMMRQIRNNIGIT